MVVDIRKILSLILYYQEKEAWKNEDEMDEKDFSPEKYFHLHDTNQDGHLNREVGKGITDRRKR